MKPTIELLKDSQQELIQTKIAIHKLETLLGIMNKRFDELNGVVVGLGEVLTLEERKMKDDQQRQEERIRLEEELLDNFEKESRFM